MGAVYRAQDLRFKVEKVVAVKEMINQATDPDIQATIVEGFEREANILATISHPQFLQSMTISPSVPGPTW